jgi:tetratricopeptide (TPR) repeat protein
MCVDAGDLSRAEAYLQRAVRLAPDFVPPRYNLAFLYNKTGSRAEARRLLQETATQFEDARTIDQWGSCLVQDGQTTAAVTWFRRAIDLQPTFVSARIHLALVLLRLGQNEEALTHLRYVLKLDPDNPAVRKLMSSMEGQGNPPPGP